MAPLAFAYAPVPEPDGPGQLDPEVVRLAVTVMYLTTFLSLLGMGYQGEHALTLTVGAGLGSITVLDRVGRFLNNRRPPQGRR